MSYTDYHRVHQVRKTASTDQLVRVRKSCLRRATTASSPTRGRMTKSASTLSATTPPRPRAETDPVVQFDPEVRVYLFQRTEDGQKKTGSNDWSHLFA